jgi:ammonia channel protein AmtB
MAYSGYTTRSNALAAVMPSILAVTVCSVQWFIIGYSFAYGEGGPIIGDFSYAFHKNVLAEPVGTIPAILFSFFQLIFQATVCAIAVGGACERGRLLPLVPFIFVGTIFPGRWNTMC